MSQRVAEDGDGDGDGDGTVYGLADGDGGVFYSGTGVGLVPKHSVGSPALSAGLPALYVLTEVLRC